MRLACIVHGFPNVSETFILDELTDALAAGVDVHLFSLTRPPEQPVHADAQELLRAGRVHYCDWPGRWGKTALLAGRMLQGPARAARTARAARRAPDAWVRTNALWLARRMEAMGIEHVHAHFAAPAGQYALAVHRWTGLPFTVTTHHMDLFSCPPDNYPELAGAASALVCISQYNRRYLIERFRLPENKLRLIHCGVRTDRFSAAVARASGNLPELLCVARLVPVKDHACLLHAMQRLSRSGRPVRLSLAGDGPQRPALERLAQELGLSNSLRLLGFQRHDQVRRLYDACDLVVLPSLSEGLPVSLMEALACAKPVVATDVRGVPELVRDGQTGRLCPPQDPDALAEAIRWMLDHPDRAAEMGRQGRALVCEQFDRRRCTAQLVQLWRESAAAAGREKAG